MLGDGYGDVKPAGAVLDLHLVGTVPGSQFAVDYADDKGIWHDATVEGPEGNQPARRPDEVAIVRYQMPRGLTAAPHAFRLRNVTAGSADTAWTATPGTTGTEKARAPWPAPSPVGERVEGAARGRCTRPVPCRASRRRDHRRRRSSADDRGDQCPKAACAMIATGLLAATLLLLGAMALGTTEIRC